MKKAFTLIELLVAVAVLAMMLTFASMIFTVSIDAYRVSGATVEIMQKLRAVTDQLNSDFKGIRKDAPLLIQFYQKDPNNRYDQVMFFADGDFQSIQLYKNGYPDTDGDKLIAGNVARVYYGQAKVGSYSPWEQTGASERKRILARRQHILTADGTLDNWPVSDMSNFDTDYDGQKKNERYEHDRLSLAQWKTIGETEYSNQVIPVCFEFRPQIVLSNPNTFHKLMCEGVSSFAIQWAYWDDKDGKGRFSWFPSTDPYGSGSTGDSHFALIRDQFGVYFNIPGSINKTGWYAVKDIDYRSGNKFAPEFFPKAIKFTFTLYDSKGIIKNGMVFTHIVYIGD